MKTKQIFDEMYINFSMNFFREVFNKDIKRQDALTMSETFCMEVIYSLGRPTVNQFASYLHLTSPNAAYKVNHLVKKGYLEKTRSEEDRRVYYLTPTEKFINDYALNRSYVDTVMRRTYKRLTEDEWAVFDKIVNIIREEQEAMKEQ